MRKYRGQAGRSVYGRVKEQVNDGGTDEKPLKRHKELFHEGRDIEVGCRILSRCYGKPSRRMINEAVLIDELKDDETINSRRQCSYVKLNKVIV